MSSTVSPPPTHETLLKLYGLHRSDGMALPQAVHRVDNNTDDMDPTETLLEVEVLHLDSLSANELRQRASVDGTDLAHHVMKTVQDRNKMHNAHTDSGGVLVGKVVHIGQDAPCRSMGLTVGTRIIPLCSMSAIPLVVEKVLSVEHDLVYVKGYAVLLGAKKFAVVPADLTTELALGAVDVSRLLPLTYRLLQQNGHINASISVVIMGCGKAGMFAAVQMRRLCPNATIVAVDVSTAAMDAMASLGVADFVAPCNCHSPKEALGIVAKFLNGRGADYVFNVVAVPGTEAATVLLSREEGTVVHFSTATNFNKAMFATDATGKDVKMVIAAGVFADAGDRAFAIVRSEPGIRALLATGKLMRNAQPSSFGHPSKLQTIPSTTTSACDAQSSESRVLWTPTEERILSSNLFAFVGLLRSKYAAGITQWSCHDSVEWHKRLHAWSVRNPSTFWDAIWDFFQFKSSAMYTQTVVYGSIFQNAKFFTGARVNMAQSILCHYGHQPALICRGEGRPRSVVTYDDLIVDVTGLSTGLRHLGFRVGDVAAAVVPNSPETVVAALSVIACGGVWTASSPDLGVTVLKDRFTQTKPTLLFVTEGYAYHGKLHSSKTQVVELLKAIPSIRHVIVLPNLDIALKSKMAVDCTFNDVPIAVSMATVMANAGSNPALVFEQVGVDHPVYVLFTSGTTGKPKCIVQGYGVFINQMKETVIHCDVKPQDTAFVYTNASWMLWHWMTSMLAIGTTLVIYDGSPFYPKPSALWEIVAEEGVSYFGCSARFLAGSQAAGVVPSTILPRHAPLRTITSTGSPLTPHSSDWVYKCVGSDIHLSSISGGTDLNGCLCIGSPCLPVRPGEIQCAPLGLDCTVYDDAGVARVGEKGELVCRAPFPAQPLYFMNDADGSKFANAYFGKYPGQDVWAHGDYAEVTPSGGFVVHGRSDTTLNPGGVRLGTGDYYNVVEKIPGIVETVVVGVKRGQDEVVALFIVMRPGEQLTPDKQAEVRAKIRTELSPKHIPAYMVAVRGVPVNINGKKLEKLVSIVVNGGSGAAFDTVANPDCIADYVNWSKEQALRDSIKPRSKL